MATQATPESQSPSMSTSPAPGNSTAAAPSLKRRAPIACRRCRRMRSKCIHDKAPPCKSCKEANVPEQCEFPNRGASDQDRQFRHPRQRAADRKAKSDAVRVKREPDASPGFVRKGLVDYKPAKVDNEWDLLPGIDVVVDGIHTFTRHYYQLGFLPKKKFPKQVQDNPGSMSVFLLLSILCISARFNKTLTQIHGDGLKAATEFMKRAQMLALHELYREPTLERCQAFYLLSIAEQGSGKSNTSYISAGIAFRMAALMRLHREEAYSPITPQSPIEHRQRAESARRTFWMLHSQDNLHSGPYKPLSLAASDITALLPCDEAEFEAGKIPERRAALEGTTPAIKDPSLTSLRPRSLFASLMQVHDYWGVIARRVLCNEKDWQPNDTDSEYAKLNRRLMDWERNLPSDHFFGKILLGGYRHYSEDLAYLGLTGCLRLCHIVLRKAYMEEMIRHAHGDPSNPEVRFYNRMATQMFCNVRGLFAQIDAQFEDGVPVERVGSQMAAFTIYGCGLMASYLCKFPQLDAEHVGSDLGSAQAEGRKIYVRTLSILKEYTSIWPLAETWCNGLEKWYEDTNPKRISFQAGTMTDGKEPQPYALSVMHPRTKTSAFHPPTASFLPARSTPPSHLEERRHSMVEANIDAPRLAPLHQTPPRFVEPVCLPPLSQAQYVPHVPQSATPQPQPQQLPQHRPSHNYTQPSFPNSSGLDMLVEASHHSPVPPPPPPPPPMDSYSNAYYPEYPTMSLNDGFDSNLQILVDGGDQWTATDATAAIYNVYGMPGFLPQQP